MTKKEALAAMKSGSKVKHRTFAEGEYIYMREDGLILTEDGYWFSNEFYKHRIGRDWGEGWSIYAQGLVTTNK